MEPRCRMGNLECMAALWLRAGELRLDKLELKSGAFDNSDPV